MRNFRFDAQATTLTNEKVLITGGNQFRSQPSFPDAEIFDPATATFTSVPNNMLRLRSGHTATLLNDGRVLIAGGDNDFPSSAEIFDPITQTFAPAMQMTQPRHGHTATKLGDGRVLVVGGDSSPFTAELYDPIVNMWTATSQTPVFPHSGHTATLLCDGRVFIAGGGSFSGSSSRNSEIFNLSSGGFTPVVANMTQFRGTHSATLLSCSEVLIVGGDNRFPATAEIFNTASELFTAIPSTNGPRNGRNDHIAALLDNGDVLISGGDSFELEVFRAATRTFERENLSFFSSVLFVRGSAAAAYQSAGNCPSCASGHKILVAGGVGGCSSDGSVGGTTDTFVYVPTNMSAPPPSITSITPSTAWTGGGTTVTITGANFQTGTGVSVSVGSTLTVTSITPTQIVGTTKARDAGAASISVTNPDSQIGSLAGAFTYEFRPAGDANGDGAISVGDVFYMINHLFAAGPPPKN